MSDSVLGFIIVLIGIAYLIAYETWKHRRKDATVQKPAQSAQPETSRLQQRVMGDAIKINTQQGSVTYQRLAGGQTDLERAKKILAANPGISNRQLAVKLWPEKTKDGAGDWGMKAGKLRYKILTPVSSSITEEANGSRSNAVNE